MTGPRTIYAFRFSENGELARTVLDAAPESWSGEDVFWFLRNGARGRVRTDDLDKARYGMYYSASPDREAAAKALRDKLVQDLDAARAKAAALESRIAAIDKARKKQAANTN